RELAELRLVFSHFDYLGHHPDLRAFPTRRSSDLNFEYNVRHARRASDLQGPALPGSRPSDAHRRPRAPSRRRADGRRAAGATPEDRKSTRLNSSHVKISYAVFCLKKKIERTRSSL